MIVIVHIAAVPPQAAKAHPNDGTHKDGTHWRGEGKQLLVEVAALVGMRLVGTIPLSWELRGQPYFTFSSQ